MFDRGVKVASFYVFSTENFKRSAEEVGHLMDILRVLP
ncbi:undecaprenyl diphosphate synthase family protein [Candidatus Saccharibacteria bacterium]|nr:undecaprenyl diphosphate synthase family protein [Candidatus Saccharibacteria bacterium]MBR3377774.1 undecaprenyl diphosphate synthase family protein [Candidatus Saccharibacteria bacterium]